MAGESSGRKPSKKHRRAKGAPMPSLKPKHRVPAPPARTGHEERLFQWAASRPLFSWEARNAFPNDNRCMKRIRKVRCQRHAAVTVNGAALCWECYRRRLRVAEHEPLFEREEVIVLSETTPRHRRLGVQVFE